MDPKAKTREDRDSDRRSRSRGKEKKSKKPKKDKAEEPEPTVLPPPPATEEEEKKEAPKVNESDLISSLKEDVSFLAKKYNEEKLPEELKLQKAEPKNEELNQLRTRRPDALGRSGGVYIPPFKLAQLQQEILQRNEANSKEHQKLMWELLRKSINGIINKVNIANIQMVIVELLNENILRGKGLLARAVIKAQMASPNFTHVYAALVAVVNTKLPEIVLLIIKRVVLQFQRAYKRNNKIVCMATTKMLAHLINQQVLSDFVGLQLLALLLENPTEDSVEIACDVMIECGQVLSDLTPAGVNAIFERFKSILHEGEIDRKVQYSIENLFAIRKTKFKDHPGIIPELDLVEAADQITHNISLDDEIDGEEMLNIFKFDPHFDKTEEEWNQIKKEILGEENVLRLKEIKRPIEEIQAEEEAAAAEEEQKIMDFTEKDLVNLRRTIYLVIMNSLDFEECVHKLLKLNIGKGHEDEVCNMLLECCMHERTYLRFYGLIAQRFCQIDEVYKENFGNIFVEKYTTIHRYETNKLRNIAKMFAHLFFSDAVEWKYLSCIHLTQEMTTSSSRIFIKILFQELAENLGLENLVKRLTDPDSQEYFKGIFPRDHPKNIRFSINFFTSIGLGALTESSRQYLDQMTQMILGQQQVEEESSDSSDSSDDDSDESDESDSDSDSDSESGSDKEDEDEKPPAKSDNLKGRPLSKGPKESDDESSSESDRSSKKSSPSSSRGKRTTRRDDRRDGRRSREKSPARRKDDRDRERHHDRRRRSVSSPRNKSRKR